MKLPQGKTILFISPHPDDETISAGALLAQLAQHNQVICYFVTVSPGGVARDITDAEKITLRQSEGTKACHKLGITPKFLNLDKSTLETAKNIKLLRHIFTTQNPHSIITVHEHDAHPTHQKTARLILNANKDQRSIWFTEVWTPLQQPTDMFFFDDKLMQLKLKALSQYKSQLERTNWLEAVTSLNRYRAITSTEVLGSFGSSLKPQGKYAEAVQIV